MKIIAALLIFISSQSFAQTTPVLLEAAFDAELIADYQQSSKIDGFCADRINCSIHETNPILGSDPGRSKLHNYFLASAVGHGAVSYFIDPKYRASWQWSTIGLEAVVIVHNRHIGLHWNF